MSTPSPFLIDPSKANLGELIWALKQCIDPLTESIGGRGAPGHDATGGTVDSVTEAIMGVTAGLCRIAGAIKAHTDFLNSVEEPRYITDAIDNHARAVESIAVAIESLAAAARSK